jgi:hypothetical protein
VDDQPVITTVKKFLTIEQCPADWRSLDLYLFRNDEVVFYVGQSQLAFDRVWEHVRDGFKGRSVMGRFILCNWPASIKFTIELSCSRSNRFAAMSNDLDAAERMLIEQWSPCFNEALNSHPARLPQGYAPPTSALRCSRSLSRLIREASYAVRADNQKLWREPLG